MDNEHFAFGRLSLGGISVAFTSQDSMGGASFGVKLGWERIATGHGGVGQARFKAVIYMGSSPS